jgi:hypothetical protein
MKTLLTIVVTAIALTMTPTPQAQAQGVHRPHYIHERQLLPSRTPTYESYFLRKYGRLPPYSRVVVPVPDPLPRGMTWSDVYVPGYGYVPTDLIVD